MSPDKPFADQFQANPQSWNSYSYVRNSPCNNVDVKGRCSAPAGLKPGQVGICIEAFIATKRFKIIGLGDGRGFSGDNEKLTARFRTDIVVTPSSDSKQLYVWQSSVANSSKILNPASVFIGSPILEYQGRAETTLNGVKAGSDGTSQATVPTADKQGSFNVSTTPTSGVSEYIDFGAIRTSFNITINTETNNVDLAPSETSGYPSFAVYSYHHDGKKIVTRVVREIPEGSPEDLKKPMVPVKPPE